ncbi:MAG: adenylate kinase [Butyrivibrio sp.]|nr:adenylate kinase [Butyrivibrio sp.]
MNKVLILGCSGSGKSTFAVKLHGLLNLPLYHLDNIWWNEDKTHITREEFDQAIARLVSEDKWIIDGDYSRTYENRIKACDTIFFLDYGQEVCMEGITGRVGQERDDMPWTEQELDPELVELVQRYDEVNKPKLYELFHKYPDKKVIVFYSREEAQDYLNVGV